MNAYTPARMRDREFSQFSSFISERVGIQLPAAKKTMLEARLQKRLKILAMPTFEEYGRFVFSPEGQRAEMVNLIDVVTTNKTDFFREPAHFDHLIREALPAILQRRGHNLADPVRIWSAGCSSGEEPYTLAMVLTEFAATHPGFHFTILASDISTRILETAQAAIYPEGRIETIAPQIKKKYLLRSKDRKRGLVRVCPELRARVSFRRINFMDADFAITEPMDIIFCRNVVIYFDKATQQGLMEKFYRQLRPGGYLYLGHSETLNGLEVDFTTVGSTVYQRP